MLGQEAILSRFKNVKSNGSRKGSFMCECPCHQSEGRKSLCITFTRDKVLFNDFGRCSTDSILAAVGLSWADVMEGNDRPHYPWYERMTFGFNQKNGGGWSMKEVYDYTDENGKYLYSKVRFEKPGKGKEIRFYRIDKKNDSYIAGKGDAEQTLYNLQSFLWAVSEGMEVFYVEGEKDVETLRKNGLYATTAGSVDDWKEKYARYFTGAKVTVIADNDKPGKDLADDVMRDIRKYAYWRQVLTPSAMPKGDVTDYLTSEGGTVNGLKGMVDACMTDDIRQYGDWLTVLKEYEEGPDGKPTDKIKSVSCKVNCDKLANIFPKGNSHLICRRGEEPKDEFFLYDYKKGVYALTNKNGLKAAIKKYAPLGTASDQMLNSVYNLLFATNKRVCGRDELDSDEDYINVKNGLYSIKEKKLLPHSDRVKSTLQLNANYLPEDKRPPFFATVFSKYIDDLCRDPTGNIDTSRQAILQEYAGLTLSNMTVAKYKKLLLLCSPRGDSGKSVFLNILGKIIGQDRLANIAIQRMNENNRFALGALRTSRLIAVGDQSGEPVEDSSILKQITGRDLIKIEKKGIQEEYILFRGSIIICCNNLPSFKDDKGDHLFDRLLLIPCENHFGKDKADPEMESKLSQELDVIFTWALEGLHRLIDNGKFTECAAAEILKREYRSNIDTVYRFIQENGYILTNDRHDMISKSVFDEAYLKWCTDNEYNAVNKRSIPNRMLSMGCQTDKNNIGNQRGIMVYRCIRTKTESEVMDDDDDFGEADFTPFD